LLGPPDCDTGPYEVKAGTSATGRGSSGDLSFNLPAGLPGASIKLTGAGGPPSAIVISPSGERLDPVPATENGAQSAPVVFATSGDETHIGIRKPGHGSWKVEAQPGPAITELAVARSLSPPKVAAKVKAAKSGKRRGSRKRSLVFHATSRKGLVVRFFEQIGGRGHLIGTTHRKRGRITFNSGDGPAGKRTIVALVEQDGLPRLRRDVAHYRAPGPIRPSRVHRLRLRRTKGGFKASWKKSAGASAYAVRIKVSDGRKLLKLVDATRLKVGHIGRSDQVQVSVTGRSDAGRAGRPASARLKGRKRSKKRR
jgi:hypothetical protein